MKPILSHKGASDLIDAQLAKLKKNILDNDFFKKDFSEKSDEDVQWHLLRFRTSAHKESLYFAEFLFLHLDGLLGEWAKRKNDAVKNKASDKETPATSSSLALQQFIGFRHAAMGLSIESLAQEMGLTTDEWEVIRDDCIFTESDVAGLDEYFHSKAAE